MSIRESKNIEEMRIERAEAIQNLREMEQMFAELYKDSFWMWDWIRTYAINKLTIRKKEIFDNIQKHWEFEK